jgi:chemotaxis protein MotB
MFRRKRGLTATIWFKRYNQSLITTGKDMTILTSKGADNVEKALESMRERLKITRMQDALTKRQCYTCFGY